MKSNLKIGKLPSYIARRECGGPLWFISDGCENYMRADGTMHSRMEGNGGTYFNTEKEAKSVMEKFAAPKTWGEMTDAEKGALLLAYHEGRTLDIYQIKFGGWCKLRCKPTWRDDVAYRVRPPEPVRETVVLYGFEGADRWSFDYCAAFATHRITFDTIDGEPDYDSIKMERVE